MCRVVTLKPITVAEVISREGTTAERVARINKEIEKEVVHDMRRKILFSDRQILNFKNNCRKMVRNPIFELPVSSVKKMITMAVILICCSGYSQTLSQFLGVSDSLVIYEAGNIDENAVTKYGDSIVIVGDTFEVVKMMLKTIEDNKKQINKMSDYSWKQLQEILSLYKTIEKSAQFSNTVPDSYKKSKIWKKYLSELKKLGYTNK